MSWFRASTLALYLAQHGRTIGARRVLELAGAAVERGAIGRLLRQQGVPVRPVASDVDALRGLPLPALLDLRSGSLLILEGLDDTTAFVRDGDDRSQRKALRALMPDLLCAWERLPDDAGGTSLRARLTQRLGEQGGELLRLAIVALALAMLGPLTSWLSREALIGAVSERSHSLLYALAGALGVAALLRASLGWLRARTCIATEARMVRAGNPAMVRRLLALPYARQQEHGFAAQWAALGSAELSARGATALVVSPVIEGLTMAAYLVVLLANASVPAAVVGGGALLTLLVSYVLARFRAHNDLEAVREAGTARARLHDLVVGIATVKAEHAERPLLLRWLDALLRERGVCMTRDRSDSWLALWLQASEQLLRLFVIGYGAFEVVEEAESLANFVYIVMLTDGLLASLSAGCRFLAVGLVVRAHCVRVDDLLGEAGVENATSAAVRQPLGVARPNEPVVRMSDVWFRHGAGQPWILQGYDLTVKAGDHLVLRGVTGMGKTTVLRLIAGLYTPERGMVSVCGRDPSRDRRDVRYLPQQAQLFAGSIRDNLEQLSGASLARIAQAAERTGIAAWLATLPMGMETVVASQGANFSGGQRQWLLLTAAVASEQRLVLLDEALSQIDHMLRDGLQIPALFADRTSVTVAHD